MSDTEEKKFTQTQLESYAIATFNEIASQGGGLDNIEEIAPKNLVWTDELTLSKMFAIMDSYEQICIIGVNCHE